ncbi:polysaccharide lyase family 7 protein [Sediminicola luteus]|uniref:Polysaccharide lyase family 7 protein n=1 Tax=Sediminicola luteus TaxID=319238 RepID=A0ABV2TRP6_9FLAO
MLTKVSSIFKISLITIVAFTMTYGCQTNDEVVETVEIEEVAQPQEEVEEKESTDYQLAKIDLSHWKLTLPIGKPTEVEPPEILNYATNETVKPYFYNDSTDASVVFYAFPNATTTNTKYSRSELREQLVPGSNSTNWTFEQGGIMKGKLAMQEVTKDADGKYHRVIIMQIHGRLTNEQKELIGATDNNAPPVLKIYWDKGKIRVKTKVLKDKNASDTDILHEEAWGDDQGYNFPTAVGFEKFTLEVKVEKGRMTIILNDTETAVYEGVDLERWNVFENYFKAGNYFQSIDEGSYAKVKYYELEVTH